MTATPYSTRRPCSEHHFATSDGLSLFYRHWPATGGAAHPKRAIALFHRGHEHGGRMAHLVDELDLPDYDFFAWDARGLGRSPGERGYAPRFASLIKDVDSFIRHIEQQHGIAASDLAIIAQSVAAVVVASWVHDYAPAIRAMVLASPAFKVKLYVPLARPALTLMQQLRPKFFVNSYVKAKFLTHDPVRVATYDTDPLITRPIAVNVLLGLYEAAERVIDDAQAIHVPTQLLISGADWIVHHAPQHRFFERLGSRDKESHLLPGFYHDTLGELERPLAIGKAREFLLRQFAKEPYLPDLRQSHLAGPSHDEFTRLSRPASGMLGLAALYWGMTRFWIRVGAHFAKGLKTGVETGFDSGSMLDYVYRNQSTGVPLLGTLVDRIFLNSIGWRGIRIRKQHLEQLIGHAIARLQQSGQPVRLVDIAAGHGRYILEAMARLRAGTSGSSREWQILLRDYSQLNVDGGKKLIAELGLSDCARFELGDAFNHADLAQLNPRPTLAVVSGLYELFADNGPINASLTGLAKAQDAGSYLIYTNQPWHPQLELIARGLSSHRQGQPWVMRRRIQAEMDQLVADAGYRKLDQLSDEWGIFSVSLAQRI